MQRQRLTGYLLAVLLVVSGAVSARAQQRDDRPRLTLEDVHASARFAPRAFEAGRWADEGPVITHVEGDASTGATHLIRYNLETNERERLIDGTTLRGIDVGRLIRIENYQYDSDGNRVLIYTDSERVWRYNTKGFYYVYDVDSETLRPLSDREHGFQMFAKFSPDGRRVGFVRDRNVFVVDLHDMSERQLTFDGSDGAIINGTSDWVYEEEFGLRDAWSWSPDGRFVAFAQFDESDTREFVMADLRGQYPELTSFRYPKAGEDNSEIRVGVIDVESGETRFFETGTWFAPGDSLEYIPQLGWTPDIDGTAYVWMFRMNRDQNRLDLLYGDPEDGSVTIVLREENDTWIDVESSFGDLSGGTLTFLGDGEHFVWMSERDGHRHLYLYRNDGTFVRQLTSGAWNVTDFHGVDLTRSAVYFTATIASPLERHLYRSPFDAASHASVPAGSAADDVLPVQITERSGTHRIDMSRDLQYYVSRFTDQTTPEITSLHASDGTLVQVLEGNEALQSLLAEYELPQPEFLEVPAADGTPLHASILKPTHFDPQRRYPLLMFVYGGPGSQSVMNSWGGGRALWHAYLAEEHGFIVAIVDNRGTGGRSKDFKSVTYLRLGIVEAEDQIAAARYFGAMDFIDESRIGIWGWSYGAYVTIMAMLYGDGPGTFRAGASIAPVTDWRQYDTIYTERYMSTPERNPDGYRVTSAMTYADRLRPDQNLLLVHGDLDDNVHLQHTIQMVDALQHAARPFRFMLYPGRDHGIFGGLTRLHLFSLVTDFLIESLGASS